ncbi:hypothetical protein BDW_06470 [Bdellovibrio bacteriovorus W]|nr:hypothetical protein BDW_06470 [Bdellovibrio bacteriovorus W]
MEKHLYLKSRVESWFGRYRVRAAEGKELFFKAE